ncbi:chromosome partitioning protein ParA [Pseudidiomarina salinarum]|uniref:Chromosome partition protein Smc n=1 Tax=Pseudidiomarina salinarum TaxID=435908 RepID=A0A094IT55_9GAMM|nr:chromosome segregation protein SMC [Pseudidiomarina salinarum]KFZ30322.1 chromosome partitioning protein ParA [Pseudidiomarina salinarum]RUO70023.1 chromosome segregation protein SMC [Pseudidiomarina salinarum]
MRLKHIKLVGFKSFVDPTKVPFPHQMTCVVGPNGCGKSNVIDAVRWVLGESSAKNLRGDAMTDVIFNGSTARKPVSQASVELVFDNSDGRIQGEYANYAEIAVKRLVTRDGQSNYYLNNSKCRRRDITDLFLGTGLGPRSYAIIEQGMISRLIESKPQELRVFLEEAAGISKYKERRRETESRIQHTRDNLDRLTDVRDELGAQLDKLQRQAAAARRYKDLKGQERKVKAELQALRWLQLESQAERIRTTIQQQETELERWLAEQRGSERGTTELREQVADAKEQLDVIQQRYYQLGNEITRTEHQLQAERNQLQQREQRRQQLSHELSQLNKTKEDDRQQQVDLQVQQQQLQPELEIAEQDYQLAADRFEAHEEAWVKWQDDYQNYLDRQQRQREQEQQVRLAGERAEHQLQRLQDDLAALDQQRVELEQELASAADPASADELTAKTTVRDELAAAIAEQTQQQQQLEQHRELLQTQREQLQQQQQQALGRQSSLQHLLAAAQGDDWPAAVGDWLRDQAVPVLGQVRSMLQVASDWQLAAEQVVAPWLDAWVVETPPSHWPAQLGARLVVLGNEPAVAGSLAAQLGGALQQWPWLQQIGLAADEAEAQALLQTKVWPMVLTPSGQLWSAAGYQSARIAATDSQLLQQAELDELEQQLEGFGTQLNGINSELEQSKHALAQLQQQLQQQREAYSQVQAEVAALAEKNSWQQQQQRSFTDKLKLNSERQQQLREQLETVAVEREELAMQAEVLADQGSVTDDDADWQQRRTQLQEQRQQLRDAMQQRQQHLQQLTMQQQQIETQLQHINTLLQRVNQQHEQAREQLSLLSEPDAGQHEELEVLALQLEELLQQREQAEESRRQQANQVSELESQLRELSTGAQGVESQIEKARAKLQSSQLEMAALQERSRNVLAVLQEMRQPLKPVLEQLPDEADEKTWQTELDRLQNAIQRLGAINLAAIEEAETFAERKDYLDQQHQDLVSSLETLETAIRKIDKETRQRFKATFDAVNLGLQELFPKVFGGGSAYLELTDADLLETGVTIMARPPGKKNSTIHLLSGGEKALTALSLVFAIFRLNPAPFCLLDEVDAPLDDANVGRFCRLVEEMSATVQFIYISHNKVAMEMASHLAGVTMQEAGVSRLVAVDIDEAVALTEAS